MAGIDRAWAWLHWRRAHRGSRGGPRHETFRGYIDSVTGRHRVDVTFDDLRCRRCEEISGRLRIPRT